MISENANVSRETILRELVAWGRSKGLEEYQLTTENVVDFVEHLNSSRDNLFGLTKGTAQEIRDGLERFERLTEAEKHLWCLVYERRLWDSGQAKAILEAYRVVAGLREGCARGIPNGAHSDEALFMAREVVNLEAALGDKYRKELACLCGGEADKVDQETAAVLRWLDHHRFAMSALFFRLEFDRYRQVSYDDDERRDELVRLKAAREIVDAEIARLSREDGV